ncbi:MAG TPA: glycolate oxidase subunit GlcE [Pseudomonadales bacterium]|nr:glycolate oxidase subunit GlcE [Pseudomonadales bacterium]
MDAAVAILQQRVREAMHAGTPLRIRAGSSKDFYGNACSGERLDPRSHTGIVAYEPSELVVTARAGTPLAELEATLDASRQMLAFEPPHFGTGATIGGCVAAGLSGPRRASAGAVRDFVLGATLLSGRAEIAAFGGTAMKNVAGYDVSRLLAGSLGVLGVILEVSLKVIPKPATEATLRFEMDQHSALQCMNAWGGQPLPVSATAWNGATGAGTGTGILHVRLSGARAAVAAACSRLGGERLDEAGAVCFWHALREHGDPYFADDAPLWRLGLPATAAPLEFDGPQLIEWGGAQRWLRTHAAAAAVREQARTRGGHATLFRGGTGEHDVFTPLAAPIAAIHRRLKAEFDPAGILNPGRLYPEL